MIFSGMLRARLTLVGALTVGLTLFFQVTDAQSPAPELASFSGRWDGKQSMLQLGECSLGNSGIQGVGIRLELTVAPDGTFSARAYFDGRKEPVPQIWTGTINPDLTVTMQAPSYATCRGAERSYSKTYKGRIIEKKRKYHLQMQTEDVPCPAQRCAFKNSIDVRQK